MATPSSFTAVEDLAVNDVVTESRWDNQLRININSLIALVGHTNLLTNPGFEVWQRGAGAFSAGDAYSADRWQLKLGSSSTLAVTRDTATVDTLGQAALKVVHTAAGQASQIEQTLEDYWQFRGKTLTFSARVRQSVAGTARAYVADNGSKVFGSTNASTGSYVTLSVSLAISTGSTGVTCGVDLTNQTDTCWLDNANLVIGGTVPDNYIPPNPHADLDWCLRYYERQGELNDEFPSLTHFAGAASENRHLSMSWNARKAVTPTVAVNGTWSTLNCATPTVVASNVAGYTLVATSGSSGQMSFFPNSTDDYVSAVANP